MIIDDNCDDNYNYYLFLYIFNVFYNNYIIYI